MKRRIGILTYHCIPNFGAQLQTLSTIAYLRSKGYEPVVLNWYPEDLKEFYEKRCPQEQNKIQFLFSQQNMPVSKICTTEEMLKNEILRLNLDVILIGSDALFDYIPKKLRYNFSLRYLKKVPIKITSNHDLPNPFWGTFNDNLDKPVTLLGYAISSQNMPYKLLDKTEKRELKRLILGFEKISVRDEWTRDMVKYISGISNVPVVPDPVFAFNYNYMNIPSKEEILSRFHLPEHYTLISFVYQILSHEYVNAIIKLIETRTNSKCVSFPMPDKLVKYDTQYVVNLPLTPVDWYALIKYSDGYIGERMHPIISCLHNSVPFFCFDQYGARKTIIPRLWYKYVPESSKIYDILQKANLLDNWCSYSVDIKISPEYIVDKLLSFSKVQCNEFAKRQAHGYEIGMSNILHNIIE